MVFDVKVRGTLDRKIKRVQQKLMDLEKPLTQAGYLVQESIEENFVQQGRPTKWLFSEAAKYRSKLRRFNNLKPPKVMVQTNLGLRFMPRFTLIDTGAAMESYAKRGAPGNVFRVTATTLHVGSAVNLNHHFAKARKQNITLYGESDDFNYMQDNQRIWNHLMLQPKDKVEIVNLIRKDITRVF